VSNVFETLAPTSRQAILRFVWREEKNASQIAGHMATKLHITFGAVSQHLGVLREAGLIDLRKHGRERWYRANRPALGPIAQYLEAQWFGSLLKLKAAAEAEETLEQCKEKQRRKSGSRHDRN
jgi:DNA-binding transcriptional ArsR family regulator